MVLLLLWKSMSMKDTAGANIDDARGLMKVMAEIRPSSIHFRFAAKLSGISGSFWPSQPTMPLSRSVTGTFSGSSPSLCLFVRVVSFVAIRESPLLVVPVVDIRSRASFSTDFRRVCREAFCMLVLRRRVKRCIDSHGTSW